MTMDESANCNAEIENTDTDTNARNQSFQPSPASSTNDMNCASNETVNTL